MSAGLLIAGLLLSTVGDVVAVGRAEAQAKAGVNPIRKVVTLLQKMQSEINAEGAKKEKMFEQYMCYCQNADGTLGKSISDAETKIPQVQSSIEEGAAMKKSTQRERRR